MIFRFLRGAKPLWNFSSGEGRNHCGCGASSGSRPANPIYIKSNFSAPRTRDNCPELAQAFLGSKIFVFLIIGYSDFMGTTTLKKTLAHFLIAPTGQRTTARMKRSVLQLLRRMNVSVFIFFPFCSVELEVVGKCPGLNARISPPPPPRNFNNQQICTLISAEPAMPSAPSTSITKQIHEL